MFCDFQMGGDEIPWASYRDNFKSIFQFKCIQTHTYVLDENNVAAILFISSNKFSKGTQHINTEFHLNTEFHINTELSRIHTSGVGFWRALM